MSLQNISQIFLPFVCGVFLSCAPGTNRDPVKRIPVASLAKPLAFVFINSDYKPSSLHKRISKPEEAASLKFYLETYGGFEVRESSIGTKDGFQNYVNTKFREGISGRSEILVFFVGHGYGRNDEHFYEDFLIPTDADLGKPGSKISDVSLRKLKKQCVSTREFIKKVEGMMDDGQFCSFHFNSCRGSALSDENVEKPELRPNFGRNISVAYSSQGGVVSYFGVKERTVYTDAFVSGMAASQKALEVCKKDPVSRDYYFYRSFHEIIQRIIAAGDSRQSPDIADSFSGLRMDYSTGNLTWQQYSYWRGTTTGTLKDTNEMIVKVTNALGGDFKRKSPEEAFENKGTVIENLTPVSMDMVLDYFHKGLVKQRITPDAFFGGDFLQRAKRDINQQYSSQLGSMSDEKLVLVCDLVIPGIRELLQRSEQNNAFGDGKNTDTVVVEADGNKQPTSGENVRVPVVSN